MKATPLTTKLPNADSIPSMGGRMIGEYLRKAAGAVQAPAAIVEIGPWLGSGTAQMALGAVGREAAPSIHTYDQFVARNDEVRKAGAEDIRLTKGQDTLPLVRSFLDPFGAQIEYHRGDIQKATWGGAAIGLYVDDAAKTPTAFYHMLSTFAGSWIPGETILVLMDYRYWENMTNARARRRLKVQQNFIEARPDCFEEIRDASFEDTPIASFRYLKPFNMGPIHRQAKIRAGLRRLTGS